MMTSQKMIFFSLIVSATAFLIMPSQGASVFFLVGEKPGMEVLHDSYVLPLTQETDIQHARDLIAYGPDFGDSIVVASIAAGTDSINRDWLAPSAPEWSWHVTEFLGFAWATIEILDGTPTMVEQDVDWWMQNTGGAIGFWGYTVIAELPEIPEPSQFMLIFTAIISILRFRRKRL